MLKRLPLMQYKIKSEFLQWLLLDLWEFYEINDWKFWSFVCVHTHLLFINEGWKKSIHSFIFSSNEKFHYWAYMRMLYKMVIRLHLFPFDLPCQRMNAQIDSEVVSTKVNQYTQEEIQYTAVHPPLNSTQNFFHTYIKCDKWINEMSKWPSSSSSSSLLSSPTLCSTLLSSSAHTFLFVNQRLNDLMAIIYKFYFIILRTNALRCLSANLLTSVIRYITSATTTTTSTGEGEAAADKYTIHLQSNWSI